MNTTRKTESPQKAESRKHQRAAAAENSAAASSGSVFANILCGVDGTRTSTAAVRMAAELAGPEGHLTLLAVTAVAGSGAYAGAAIAPERADLVLRNAKRVASRVGVRSTSVIDPGRPPVEVILARARTHDLFAIGAPATSSLGGMLIGGVATVALSRFTTPMLVARRSTIGSLRGREILVASDGEEGSARIVELAGRLAASQGARVTLVNAIGAESKMNPRAVQAQARALRKIVPDAGEPLVEPGKALQVILTAVKKSDAALLVMGSRRLSGLHALGSVSRRMVHDAPCSVLVIPPQ